MNILNFITKPVLKYILGGLVLFTISFSGCKEKGCTDPSASNYDPDAKKDDGSCQHNNPAVPTEYKFSNVSYKGQVVRLLLLKDLSAKIGTATTTTVTAAELNAIYENTTGSYANIASGKKIKEKVPASVDSIIQNYFSQIENLSQGSPRGYVNADSVDLKQLVEKTLMGAVLFRDALNYLSLVPNDNNDNVTEGQGTNMEHHWDEAFGYFGAARDYNKYSDAEIISPGTKDTDGNGSIDTTSERCAFYGQTAAKRDVTAAAFTSSTDFTNTIFSAWVQGRHYISNKDYAKRDQASTTVKDTWEKIIAATVIHYINDFKADVASGSAAKNAHWAELRGYFEMIGYRSDNKLGASNYSTISTYIGSKPADATAANLDLAAAIVKAAYGFTDEQITNW